MFANELSRVGAGDAGAVGDLLRRFPQAILFEEFRSGLYSAAKALDPEPFSAAARALARLQPKRLGSETQKTVAEVERKAAANPSLSRRAIIRAMSRGGDEDTAAYRKLNEQYKRFVRASRTYPRAKGVVVEHDVHVGNTSSVFDASMDEQDAPRLFMNAAEHPRLHHGEYPPGDPVIAPRYDTKWRLEISGQQTLILTPSRPLKRH